MRLYLKYLDILFRSQIQYRVSFFLVLIGQFFMIFTLIAGVYFLFQRFGTIKGWQFFEVALCFSVIHMSYSICVCFARGFDVFSKLIVKGDFDRILVRPRNTILQVLGSNFEFTRLGRLLQAVVVLIWALANVAVNWTLLKCITLILMIISGIFIFIGLFILGATLSFWTIEGLEVVNVLTDGGRDMAQYPLNIYKDWARKFFTFIIPFGCVNYLPLMYILDKTNGNELFYMITPVYGILFIIPCLFIWRVGVRHYKSTGS